MHNLSFNPRDVEDRIFDYLNTINIQDMIDTGLKSVHDWASQEYYPAKQTRIAWLMSCDLWELASDLTMMVCGLKTKVTLVTLSSMLAPKLKMKDKFQAVYIAAEFICMFSDSEIYDVSRQKGYSAWVIPKIELPQELVDLICYSVHTPPAPAKPTYMAHNRDSIYDYQDGRSLLLGGAINHHEGNISLDVITTQNNVRFSINTQFINKVTEVQELDESEYDEDTYQTIIHNWEEFQNQCDFIYALMIHQGNSFNFQHRIDKRGRIYSHGYHINPMGSSFKKAMLDFTEQHHIPLE